MENKSVSQRRIVELPIGYEDPGSGEVQREAEVRAATGGDEMYIGMSSEYDAHPNDLVYKTLLLSRTVTRLGARKLVTIDDIMRLHAQDIRALENAVYALTYGEEVLEEGSESSG